MCGNRVLCRSELPKTSDVGHCSSLVPRPLVSIQVAAPLQTERAGHTDSRSNGYGLEVAIGGFIVVFEVVIVLIVIVEVAIVVEVVVIEFVVVVIVEIVVVEFVII